MKLEVLNQQIVDFDQQETESAHRETTADAECTAAKAAADVEFASELAAANAKRVAAYQAADTARQTKREAERAANAERTTELKGAFQDAYGYLTFQNQSLVDRAKSLEPFKNLVADTMTLLNPPPPPPGDMTVEVREVVQLDT